MTSVFINNEAVNWICNRLRTEWYENHPEALHSPVKADVIWILCPWEWRKISPMLLQRKRVLCTIHHIDPEKYNETEVRSFRERDNFVTVYHAPCEQTKEAIKSYTSKPVYVHPFWVNQDIWRPLDRREMRRMHGMPDDTFLVGSFQKDTEGGDLRTPKLSKGPDVFCEIVSSMAKEREVEVLLSGWRRQYVIHRLKELGIRHHYYELTGLETLNSLYNMIDLYVVSSRIDGGPQSIVECALTRTPIVSTPVGIAPLILSSGALYTDVTDFSKAVPNQDAAWESVRPLKMPRGFTYFEDLLEDF